MTLVFDAGALIRIERGDVVLGDLVTAERRAGRLVVTHGGVVGQVWRDGRRQAWLARALRGIEVVPLDADLGRRAGALLRHAVTDDVIDAAVALLAHDGDVIYTSDPDDLLPLVVLGGADVRIIRV